jgi:hypothetical protein
LIASTDRNTDDENIRWAKKSITEHPRAPSQKAGFEKATRKRKPVYENVSYSFTAEKRA